MLQVGEDLMSQSFGYNVLGLVFVARDQNVIAMTSIFWQLSSLHLDQQ